MPEMHLRQPGPFTKNIKRIQKFMQIADTNYIYKNELDKACFQHDMAYGKYKDLQRKIQSDKVLKDKAFEIANNPKYDGYQRRLVSMVWKFFDKKSKGAGIKYMPNQHLANEFHKPIIRKFKRGIAVANAFQSILDNSKRKPNKIWIDQGSEFYNTYFKK